MRRTFFLLLSLAMLAQPAVSASADSQIDQVRQQLATASTDITDTNARIAALDQSIGSTQDRVAQERKELSLLSRSMYAEPDSVIVAVAESNSLADALTRFTELAVAGERAAATKRKLDSDVADLSRQREAQVADLHRQQALQKRLEAQYSQLQQLTLADPALANTEGPLPAPASIQLPRALAGAAGGIQQIILDAFAPLGPGAQAWAIRIAKCESGYNPNAVNRSSGASGLFQFLPSTWAHSPYAAQSPFDPVANAHAAAWLYSRSGPAAWQCK